MRAAGFLDTLSVFRCHTTPPYKQEKLYKRLIGGTYDAHNAIEDVKALERTIDTINPSPEESRIHTFKVQYILDVQEYRKNAAFNLIGWQLLIKKGVITKHMAEKAAKSGLRPEHLEFSYTHGGDDAVYSVLSKEAPPFGYRVTNNKAISKKISEYFKNKQQTLLDDNK